MTGPERPEVDRMLAPLSDGEVAKLLASIFPTRTEQALELVSRAAHLLGDRADSLRRVLQWRRAEQGRHLVAKERHQ